MSGEPENIEVSIVAKIEGLLDGLAKATQGVKNSTNEMSGAFEGLGKTIENLKAPFLAITAVMAGGAIFKEAIDGTIEWTMNANKLSKILNLNTQDASTWAVALHTLGVSTDQMAGIVARLQGKVSGNGAAFEKWGIELKNAQGGALPMNQVIENMAEKYQGLNTDQEKNTMLFELAGRGWMNMLPIMRMTTERLAEAKKEAEELHLVVGPEGVAKALAYQEANRKIGLIWESMTVQVGSQLMPALTQLGKWFGEIGPGLAMVIGGAIKSVVTAFYTLKFAIENVVTWITDFFLKTVNGFKTIGNVISAVLHGNWAGAVDAAKAGAAEHERITAESIQITKDGYKKLGEDLAKIWDEQPTKGKDTGDAGPDPGKPVNRVPDWQQELEKIKALRFQAEGDMAKMSEAEERGYWATKLALSARGSDEWIAVRMKMATLGQAIDKEEQAELERMHQENEAIEKKRTQERIAMAKITKDLEINEARTALAAEKENLDHSVAMGQMTNLERLNAEKEFRQREQALEMQALTNEQQVEGTTLIQWQQIQMKKVEAHRKAMNDINKLEHQSAEERKKVWDDWFKGLTSGFQNAINGLVKGTMTWAQATKNVIGSAVDFVIAQGWKAVSEWIMAENAKTGATMAGTVMRGALELAAALKSVALAIWTGLKWIAVQAWQAAAGAYNAIVSIPFVGPFLAPAAAGVALVGVMGMASHIASASGGWDRVPSDQLASIHKDEMVLSAPMAQGLRNIISQGGAGSSSSGDVHVNFHGVVDAKTFFQQNQGHIVRTINDAVKKRRTG